MSVITIKEGPIKKLACWSGQEDLKQQLRVEKRMENAEQPLSGASSIRWGGKCRKAGNSMI